MYGTVMIARMTLPVGELEDRRKRWESERGRMVGHIDTRVMAADDGRVVMMARFESKEAYLALADDPRQSEWWEKELMPILDGEPEWIDGEWIE
jgi:hypothetical protein